MNALPAGWKVERLKDVASLRNEKTDVASELEDYLELEDLDQGTGRILSRRNTLEVGSAVTLFKKGDVLFGKLRPYLEKYWLAEFDGKCTGEILAFQPLKIAGRFLFYFVASPAVIARCNLLAYGAKMPRVNWPTQLATFEVLLPPLAEQHRIAAFLDASCAAIDAAMAAKRGQVELLEALQIITIHTTVTKGLDPRAKLKAAGEDWLSETAAHWKPRRIKDLAKLSPRYSGQQPSDDESCTIVPMELLSTTGSVDTFVSAPFADVSSGLTLFEAGDVLFAKITPCMENGKGAFVAALPTRYAFGSTEFHVLRPREVVVGRFLYYYTYNPVFRAYAAQNMSGAAGQKRVSSRFLKETRVFIPPATEMRAIVSFLESKCGEFRQLFEQLKAQITTLTAYRKSLIHECVTGQRRISEADLQRLGIHG